MKMKTMRMSVVVDCVIYIAFDTPSSHKQTWLKKRSGTNMLRKFITRSSTAAILGGVGLYCYDVTTRNPNGMRGMVSHTSGDRGQVDSVKGGAMSEISRHGLASECFGFDPVLAQMRMKRASLGSDARTLGEVVKKAGLIEGIKLVAAGRNFLDPEKFSAHLAIEADSEAAIATRVAAARHILGRNGREIDNSIPKVLRSQPFVPPNNMLGPAGERWVPVHGIVPHSCAAATHAAVEALFARERDTLAAHAIEVGYLLTTVAAQGFLICLLYTSDAADE